MSRLRSSIKNLSTAIVGQIFGIIIGFLSRIIFLRYLNEEYLGLNSLFTNILTIFSLIELGIGPAMNFSLYKPLAEGNILQIKSLMVLYKKAYIFIGCTIGIIGILFTPFYTFFLDTIPNIPRLTYIYWLFTLNTVLSYFFSYKRALIICDERRYIATIYRYAFYFIMNVAQILVLCFTHSYIVYLVVQILATLTENIAISRKADRLYQFLTYKNKTFISKETTKEIKKNISAMLMHKIGGIIVNSTDNLILSKYVGLAAVGVYSNYFLITDAINRVVSQFFSSVTASIGNMNALRTERNIEKLEKTFDRIFFLNFWIYGFCSCCLWVLFNPFISLWLGSSFLFDHFVVFVITLNFYITGMRKSALTFREATGAFYYDRWKPIFESVINIVASIILAKKLGTAGVFLGTIISTLSTCIWVEPCVLYKHVFQKSARKYAVHFVLYTLLSLAACVLTSFLANCLRISNVFLSFICKCFLCLTIPNLLFLICFYRTEHFQFFMNLICSIIKQFLAKLKRTHN